MELFSSPRSGYFKEYGTTEPFPSGNALGRSCDCFCPSFANMEWSILYSEFEKMLALDEEVESLAADFESEDC